MAYRRSVRCGVSFGARIYRCSNGKLIQGLSCCLSDPLPTMPESGTPVVSTTITLPQLVSNTPESVGIVIWRVACPGGVSALVGSIQRAYGLYGTQPAPGFPTFGIRQNNWVVGSRIAIEPNTVRSYFPVGTPVVYSFSFVFEIDPIVTDLSPIDFNKALEVEVYGTSANPLLPNLLTSMALPDYNPALYPSNSAPMPVTGYNSGAYYDSTHGGEGMLVQVVDVGGGPFFFAAWYTFDKLGVPYWLTAQGAFTKGATQISVPMFYTLGGGFAGNFPPPVQTQSWGTMTVSFPDCNTMSFSYNGAVPGNSNSPAGSGSKTWHRLGAINGFLCN